MTENKRKEILFQKNEVKKPTIAELEMLCIIELLEKLEKQKSEAQKLFVDNKTL